MEKKNRPFENSINSQEYLFNLQTLYPTHETPSEAQVDQYFKNIKKLPALSDFFQKLDEESKEEIRVLMMNPLQAFQPLLENYKLAIISTLSSTEQRLLLDIPVGSLYTFEPNAWTISVPGGGAVIVVHNGLFGYIQDIARIISAVVRVKNHDKDPVVYDDWRILSEKALYTGIHFLTDGRYGGDHFVALGEGQDFVASLLRQNMEIFVLAHEFGHNVLGHVNVARKIHGLFDKTDQVIERYQRTWEEEIAADQWAVEVLISLDAKIGSEFWLAPIAAPIFFAAYRFLERVSILGDRLQDLGSIRRIVRLNPNGEYPPASVRLAEIIKTLQPRISPEYKALADFITKYYEELANFITRSDRPRFSPFDDLNNKYYPSPTESQFIQMLRNLSNSAYSSAEEPPLRQNILFNPVEE